MRDHVGRMLLMLALALPAIAMTSSATAQPTVRDETAPVTATFCVKEMACHGCAERIQDSLRKRAGVSKVVATVKTAQVAVTFDRTKTTSTEIKQALDKLGFEATLLSEARTRASHRDVAIGYAAPRPIERSASTLTLPVAQQSASWPLTTTAGTR